MNLRHLLVPGLAATLSCTGLDSDDAKRLSQLEQDFVDVCEQPNTGLVDAIDARDKVYEAMGMEPFNSEWRCRVRGEKPVFTDLPKKLEFRVSDAPGDDTPGQQISDLRKEFIQACSGGDSAGLQGVVQRRKSILSRVGILDKSRWLCVDRAVGISDDMIPKDSLPNDKTLVGQLNRAREQFKIACASRPTLNGLVEERKELLIGTGCTDRSKWVCRHGMLDGHGASTVDTKLVNCPR